MNRPSSALTMLLSRHTRRREFIRLLGVGAAWPLAARAQQAAMPVVEFLHPTSVQAAGDQLHAFHQGLKEADFVDGENVAIEYRWADNRTDRLGLFEKHRELVPEKLKRRPSD